MSTKLLCFLNISWISLKIVKMAQLDTPLNTGKHLKTFILFTPHVFHMLMDKITSIRSIL